MTDCSAVQLHDFIAAPTHSIDEPELVIRTYRSYEVLKTVQHLRGVVETTTRIPILQNGELDFSESSSKIGDRRRIEARTLEENSNMF